jgi:hypothetical protein
MVQIERMSVATSSRSSGSLRRVATAEQLIEGNINPQTGLATDYLNHFNEAIMLLDMVPDMPDCAEDFLSWQPLSYADHFHASNFAARDLAIAAYEHADPAVRAEFDALTETMTTILIEVARAMMIVRQDSSRAKLAVQAADWLRPLVMQVGGVINGVSQTREISDIDAIMADAA